MFPEAKGNKTHFYPWDQSLSVLLHLPIQKLGKTGKKSFALLRLAHKFSRGFRKHCLITCESKFILLFLSSLNPIGKRVWVGLGRLKQQLVWLPSEADASVDNARRHANTPTIYGHHEPNLSNGHAVFSSACKCIIGLWTKNFALADVTLWVWCQWPQELFCLNFRPDAWQTTALSL